MMPPVMVVKMLGGLFEEVVLVFSCQVEVVAVVFSCLPGICMFMYLALYSP